LVYERDRLVRPTMKYLRIGLALPCSLVPRQCLHVCAKLLGKKEVGIQEPMEVEQLLWGDCSSRRCQQKQPEEPAKRKQQLDNCGLEVIERVLMVLLYMLIIISHFLKGSEKSMVQQKRKKKRGSCLQKTRSAACLHWCRVLL